MTCWTKGIVDCTCGTCLRPSDKVRKLNKDRFDVFCRFRTTGSRKAHLREHVTETQRGKETYQSPRSLPKAVFKPNLYHGRQDRFNLEARTSVDHQSKESEEYGETCGEEFGETRGGNVDFRLQGLPHSIVQKQDDVRRETVKKLIHQFEHTQIASRRWQTWTRTKNSICSGRSRRN